MQSLTSRSLIFDCVYDTYKWVVAYIKVVEWSLKAWDQLYLIHTDKYVDITEVWHFTPEYKADKTISHWQIGYVVTWEKSVRNVQIWDTFIGWISRNFDITAKKKLAIPGFKRVKPYVYAGIYPIDTNDYDKLKDSLEKLSLNDSSIEYEMEDSKALGFGFRCGFLWMLHMDIIKERLAREYNIETIFTIPTVVYLVKSKLLTIPQIKSWNNIQNLIKTWFYKYILPNVLLDKVEWNEIPQSGRGAEWNEAEDLFSIEEKEQLTPRIVVRSWVDMIDYSMIDSILEPIANVEIVWPQEYAWNIMSLCQEYRWKIWKMDYIDETRVVRHYQLPMWEIIIDFYDRLKSATKGYATMNYEFKNYQEADLVKLDIFINNEKVEALSRIVHKDNAYYKWKEAVERLKVLIPKHLFVIPIQAWIWNKMIARENISAIRKDVIAKCYGWDITRKRKLLERQKEWKKKMKAIWSVNVPSDVFIKMVARW